MIPHDIVGVGIGPFNLGLAALMDDAKGVSSLFLERKPRFVWHEGLLLPGTTLQVPFLADLVTLVDPTHRLSYLAYLKAQDRLYKFYFHEHFHIPRIEYDHYCRWACEQLASCRFGEEVVDVRCAEEPHSAPFLVRTRHPTRGLTVHAARNIALGIGTQPHLPAWATDVRSDRMFHSAAFAQRRADMAAARRVVVVGSGQSAAECVLSLLQDTDPSAVEAGRRIVWITRSDGFFPMEYSKLGLEHFSPDYMRYFHRLPGATRARMIEGQALLYKGISIATIAAIFDLLYERSIGGRDPGLSLLASCAVEAADEEAGAFRLTLHQRHQDVRTTIKADAVIAATGYRHQWPHWFEAFKRQALETDASGGLTIGEDFRAVRCGDGPGAVFVQNAETLHHGVGSPDLGLGAFRNARIVNALLGEEKYRLPERTVFQDFGLPAGNPSGNAATDSPWGERHAIAV